MSMTYSRSGRGADWRVESGLSGVIASGKPWNETPPFSLVQRARLPCASLVGQELDPPAARVQGGGKRDMADRFWAWLGMRGRKFDQGLKQLQKFPTFL